MDVSEFICELNPDEWCSYPMENKTLWTLKKGKYTLHLATYQEGIICTFWVEKGRSNTLLSRITNTSFEYILAVVLAWANLGEE